MFLNTANPLPVGAPVAITIPPFATSVRVARAPGAGTVAPQITININAGANPMDAGIVVAAGTPCPEINLSGQASLLSVTDSDGAITAAAIAAIFTIGI